MKSLLPWFYLVAATGSQAVGAAGVAQPVDGLIGYRQGEYFQAAQNLIKFNQAQMTQYSSNPTVNYYLGRMRLYGYGLLKNNDLALRYLTKAGEQGLLSAQQWLGKYYLQINKPDLALTWFKRAADQADYSSQMYTAAAYLFGYGAGKNPDAARRYYIEAARSGSALAQYTLAQEFLSSRDKSNRKLGVIWLNKAAAQGYRKAEEKLGELYATGNGVTRDEARALELLSKAGDKGSSSAQLALGMLYADKKAKVYDPTLAVSWLEKSAEKGSIIAQQTLASIYKDGKIVPADLKLAEKWQEKAKARQTYIEKHPVDPAKTIALWLTEDKDDDLAKTSYALGGIYSTWKNPIALQQNNYNASPKMHLLNRQELYKPQFVLASPKEIPISDYFDFLAPILNGNTAASWNFPLYPIDNQIQALADSQSYVLEPAPWVSVIDDGRTYPQIKSEETGNYFDEMTAGWEVKANFQQVLTYLYYRSILGDAEAQFKLGQLYEYGIVVAKNIEQSIIYYELAALQQDVRAEYNLGVLYLEGKTTPVNYQKGIDWMMDAAFKGNAYAQYALGNIYENGLSDPQGVSIVAQNHQQALAMFYLASANHYDRSQYRLAEFLSKENNGVLSVAARQNRTKLVKRLYQDAAQSGVVDAILPAAFYEAMDDDATKQKHAYQVAEEQALKGNSLAALLLGMAYERGIGVPASQADSIYWYQQASLNPVSEYILGTYSIEGNGVSQDAEKGRALLQKSADAGFAYANYNLAIVKKELNEPFLPELDKARQLGNSKAGLLLADYYLVQANDPEKMQQARDIYQHFADKGDRNAQVKLAFLYDRGLGGQVDLAMAANWYTLSATQGQPIAQYLLGRMYQLGKIGAEPDYAAAKKWYELARKSYVPAAVALGFVFDTVDDNYSYAWENYQLAAKHGDVIGQYNLGLIYEQGKGQPVDMLKAQIAYQSAADKGYTPAMTQLAGLHFKGVNGQRDEEKALFWYQKSAELGNREANYQLGLLSETGVGLELNFAKAVKYYQQAADLGDEKAVLALARMYQYGLGVQKDPTHAAELYRTLASNNNAYSQYQLAILYADGSLGTQQPDESKRLLALAKANGSLQAENRLQWMNAQQEAKVSFIQPVLINNLPEVSGQSADLMYLDALSEWNRGDELSSRTILNRLLTQFPQYSPAKWATEQLG